MPKRFTGAHLAELAQLRERCLLVLDFFADRGGMADDATRLRAIVEKAVAQGNLGGLRTLWGDLSEWMRALPQPALKELEHTLTACFGPDIKREQLKRKEKIRGILDRGEVRTETEYRLVLEYLEEILEDPTRLAEIEKLNDALAKYS